MFILDSLFISGLRFVFDKVATAVDAEMNDDTVLREELLAAEMRREMGEISDEEFAAIETDLLTRIRDIRERREGGSGPIAFGAADTSGGEVVQVEAMVSGDFHERPQSIEPAAASRRGSSARGSRRPTRRRASRTAR